MIPTLTRIARRAPTQLRLTSHEAIKQQQREMQASHNPTYLKGRSDKLLYIVGGALFGVALFTSLKGAVLMTLGKNKL